MAPFCIIAVTNQPARHGPLGRQSGKRRVTVFRFVIGLQSSLPTCYTLGEAEMASQTSAVFVKGGTFEEPMQYPQGAN